MTPLLDVATTWDRFGTSYPLALVGGGVVLYAIGPNLIAAAELSGPEFLTVRLMMGVPILTAVVLGARGFSAPATPGSSTPFEVSWLWSILAGCSFALHQLCFMTAVKRTSVADAALLDTLSPVVIMIIAIPMFGERPTPRFLAWSFVAMSGAGVLVLAGASGPSGDPVGMALAGAAVIFFALFFLFSKAARPSSDVWSFLLIVSCVAAVVVLTFLVVARIPFPSPSTKDLWLALALAIGPGTLGHYLMTWPLAQLPANVPPVVRLLTPFLASAIAWTVLAQPMHGLQAIGGAITAAGVFGSLVTHRTEQGTY